MSNGPTHQLAGAIAGIAICVLDKEETNSDFHNPVAAGAIGAMLGKLPDWIEPATNPNHRQFFHSVIVLSGLAMGVKKLYEWEPEDDGEKLLRSALLIGGAAYLSHLALDSLTSKSLPLVGKL